jgi:hypothetical protein
MSTQITTLFAGQVGVNPGIARMSTTDSYAAITTAGYLDGYAKQGYVFNEGDIIATIYDSDGTPGTVFLVASISSSVITLSPMTTNVTLPVIANHIAVFSNTAGDIGDDVATAINGGNIQAGLSGTAGTLASFPATASKGSLKVTAVANTGNTVTTISNAAMGQASVVSIPDPAAATASFVVAPSALVNGNLVKASGTAGLVVDAGARIIANTTASYAGGGTSNAFTATGLTVASVGSAVIRASTNAVSIAKALPGTDTLTITFSADPGASTTVDYIYSTAAQA